MNLSKFALIMALVLGSGTAIAEGGAERSQAFWAEFRKSQERVHGQGRQEVAQKEVEQTVAKD
ncbi:hypothetical protein [Pseudomonas aegrilactucae]|uniref:Uncharacterized protein n=1 Tax=Pseudomonas aegrilactucae TaxID=2854028 RepID=A0A9Q3ABG6_9PSED|nr:hypothetical protein [Pseudomonas aegrilactucae]MBV6286260.1 hypothetical protein [Pseudomonas aegrilactucae]